MYEKEAKQQEEKIEKMKTDDPDDYSIKKQVKKFFSLGYSLLIVLFCLNHMVYRKISLPKLLDFKIK